MWQGTVGHGSARLGMAGRGEARLGKARRGAAIIIERFKSMSVLSKLEQGNSRRAKRIVELEGVTPIMFDRYAGDNKTELSPWQKAYYLPDGKTFALPSKNIMSFLSAVNTNSVPKRLLDSRKYKQTALAALSYVSINPIIIPFLRNDEPIMLGEPNGDHDTKSEAYIDRTVARLDKGIPNPKTRPVLPCPWTLKFQLELFENDELQEQQLCWLFVEGGRAVGLGTYRGVFGKFIVKSWDEM